MNPKSLTDNDLVAQCASMPGSRAHLNELVRRFGPVVKRAICWTLLRYGRAGCREEPDVFQDVFVSLLRDGCRSLRRFDPQRSSMATYLGIIARNATINALTRIDKRTVPIGDDVASPDTELDIAMEIRERRDQVHQMVAQMSAKDRLFYHLYFEECMPPESIARAMGIGTDTVYSKKAKIIDKIRVAVGQSESVEPPPRP